MFRLIPFALLIFLTAATLAQTETLTNKTVIEMTKAGLSTEIIIAKIRKSEARFDTSASALIELKNSGVADEILTLMMGRVEAEPRSEKLTAAESGFSDRETPKVEPRSAQSQVSAKEQLPAAKTISFEKSSLQPSRQALEKELLKRKDFRDLNLTILRYKEKADLYVEIGFVSGSLITHRYVYRIYDRRTGAVITAGETTSWGSLAENLARHISKRLTVALNANAQK
ncbi:MAG: hypothetical protein ACT4O9_05035 [Blastocatellia bacterium]